MHVLGMTFWYKSEVMRRGIHKNCVERSTQDTWVFPNRKLTKFK